MLRRNSGYLRRDRTRAIRVRGKYLAKATYFNAKLLHTKYLVPIFAKLNGKLVCKLISNLLQNSVIR